MASTPVMRYKQIEEDEGLLTQRSSKPVLANEPDRNSKFLQQTLSAWHPVRSTQCVISTFFLTSLLCIVLGVCIIAIGNQDVVEYSERYDDQLCDDKQTYSGPNCKKSVEITTENPMQPPIFVYYKLVDFYQNHRTYTASEKKILSVQFNDTIEAPDVSFELKRFELEEDVGKIVWSSDLRRFPKAKDDAAELRKIVWRRVAAMPTFKKIHTIFTSAKDDKGGKVLELPKGTKFNFNIMDRFDGAGAEKWVVISTTSRLGGTQYFLAWAFIFVGAVMLTVASLMACMTYVSTSDHEKYFIQ